MQTNTHPYIFRHQFGTLTVFATKPKKAIIKARRIAQGLSLVPQFQVEART